MVDTINTLFIKHIIYRNSVKYFAVFFGSRLKSRLAALERNLQLRPQNMQNHSLYRSFQWFAEDKKCLIIGDKSHKKS